MVNVQQQLINPSLGRTDYSQTTRATMAGLNEVLLASKEKQNRIRASLAEVRANNKASADAQAAWMGAIQANEELLQALDAAPPRIQKAYLKAEQGKATLEDNSVIASYLNMVNKGLQEKRKIAATALNTRATEADIDYKKAMIEQAQASALASQALANERNAAAYAELMGDGANTNTKVASALLAGSPYANSSGTGIPNLSAINTSPPAVTTPPAGMGQPRPTPNIPPMLLKPQPPAPAPAPAPTFVDPTAKYRDTSAPAPAPTPTPDTPNEVLPQGQSLFTDSKGNEIPMTRESVQSPEVQKLVSQGAKVEDAVREVRAKDELKKAEVEYVIGDKNEDVYDSSGNLIKRKLPTFEEYQTRLVLAGVDIDDARKQTETAAASGAIYTLPTSTELRKRKEEFQKTWELESGILSELISDNSAIAGTAEEAIAESDKTTTGLLGIISAAARMGVPGTGTSAIQLKKFISRLRADSALGKIDEMKKAAVTGATGLGQVSVIEFTSLIEQGNIIDQGLSADELDVAINRYVYERNKVAYMSYMRMAKKFGKNAVNSLPGVSEQQMASILSEIDIYENMSLEGKKIKARAGSFLDRVEKFQMNEAKDNLGGGTPPVPSPPVPSPTVNQNTLNKAREQAEFTGRELNRNMNKEITKELSTGRILPSVFSNPMASMTPPILRFFNVIPDMTDEKVVNDIYQNIVDDVEVE